MTLRIVLVLGALAALGACNDTGGNGKKNKSAGPVDADNDGVAVTDDCDDTDPTVAPGMPDTVGDGIDQDCDGLDGVDADGDGVASSDSGGGDCDDADPATIGVDGDGDGWAECTDCDDNAAQLNPGMPDACDGWDNDCSGTVDRDADGVGVCLHELSVLQGSDILFVIDNSCSMADEQATLAGAAPGLMSALLGSGLDFHVGSVSTDTQVDQGILTLAGGVRWVDDQTPDPTQTFESMVLLGTGGSATERGLDAAKLALDAQVQPGAPNEGFLRDDAHLDLVFLSDEDDQSQTLPGDFVAWLDGLKGAGTQVRIHNIVSPNPVCPTAAAAGDGYEAVRAQLGGYFESICDPPWDDMVADMASTVPAATPTSTFYLTFEVDPTSLAAEVLDVNQASVASYGSADLVWDATDRSVTLPAPVDLGETLQLFFALP